MTDVLNIENSKSFPRQSQREWLKRAKTSVLLAVLLFVAAAQTLHHHGKFSAFSEGSRSAGISQTSNSPAQLLENQDDCLICQLQGQYSTIQIFHTPRVVLKLKVKPVRAAVFLTAEFYHSAKNLQTGGRAPPAAFLS